MQATAFKKSIAHSIQIPNVDASTIVITKVCDASGICMYVMMCVCVLRRCRYMCVYVCVYVCVYMYVIYIY
jgi:hypothetical protein